MKQGRGNRGCLGARPGDGVCKVWVGRVEGKEEEKSNLLTSKSCTMGTSREGGHAATEHREMEITTTEATAPATPNHPTPPVPAGPQEQRLEGHACQRLGCRGRSKARGSPRARNSSTASRTSASWKLGSDWAVPEAGTDLLLALTSSQAGTQQGEGEEGQGLGTAVPLPSQAGLRPTVPPHRALTKPTSPTHCSETQVDVLSG